ncbi:hypothetical protein [Algoriphagus halophilus]|uniref:Uncharacterized protein n=1 Tax=Algoriphagus halophilus TaxID=226505 RepID=A0A1N6G7K1_9BACT|nr:hypothetical protein [Algoriphagus halophilus]SIO03392.1 hypothetical protein SAMN05444394_3024 [Algoriphagus halophilus]
MEDKLDTEKRQEELSWLENLQRNSWEPEVIISGITLAFLFAFPSQLFEFAAYLIQDLGTGFLPAILILVYSSTIISVFKIFFVVHLILRFVWAGLLGLSYAFPEGVIEKNLFKSGQGYHYQKPDEMVLKLERICSMTFAFPVSLVITFLILTVYLGILISIYIWLDLPFLFIYLIFLMTVLGFVFFSISSRRTRFKKWYASTIISSISSLYQSNLGKWFTVFYAFFIFILAIPIIMTDIEDFGMFDNERNIGGPIEREWPAKYLHFEDYHDPEKRYPRAFIDQEITNDNIIEISIARYEGDRKVMEDIKKNFSGKLDSLQWRELTETAHLHRIYVNDSLIPVSKWSKVRFPNTKQKIYQAVLDLKELAPGPHTLRVEKLMLSYDFFSNKPEFKVLENWSTFEFIKQ